MSANPADAIGASQSPQPATDRPWLDRIGLSASLLCAIHCLAAPFLLLLLPAAGSIWAHPAVHWVLALLVVPLAIWVLYNGYRKHRNRLTLVAATAGAMLILAGLISPMVHDDPVLEFTVPAMFSQSNSTAASASIVPIESTLAPHADASAICTEPCCPSITQDAETGTANIAMPPGGLLTLLGSVLLVLAHTSNLIACRCFSKTKCNDSACGCPA